MGIKTIERWRKLCRLAMQEQDAERLLGRCNEIQAELEGHEEEIYEQLCRNEIFGPQFHTEQLDQPNMCNKAI